MSTCTVERFWQRNLRSVRILHWSLASRLLGRLCLFTKMAAQDLILRDLDLELGNSYLDTWNVSLFVLLPRIQQVLGVGLSLLSLLWATRQCAQKV